ncbi:hypothetical protein PARMER_00089 [Parabacteroides merdae ATCC 43184]|nr:hypothetical protein PARMER_00089 [Parabacteroides merdae ATCC 43184]
MWNAGKAMQMPASSNISFFILIVCYQFNRVEPQRYIFSCISFEERNIICYFASKL